MLATILRVLLLAAACVPAVAADAPKGPYLADLMKLPAQRAAWYAMLAGETPPSWVEDFAKTLDGPPTPSIPLKAGDQIYTLGFTCKVNECGDNQLFVLFSRGGAKAWGLLLTGGQQKWLGAPDEAIKQAILSGID